MGGLNLSLSGWDALASRGECATDELRLGEKFGLSGMCVKKTGKPCERFGFFLSAYSFTQSRFIRS